MKLKTFLGGLCGFSLIFSIAGAEEIRYDSGNRRDPFIPLVGANAVTANMGFDKDALPIEGIIYDPKEGSYALIGGEIYREGDRVGNAIVMQILPKKILLLQESKEVVVWLREETVEGSSHKEKPDQAVNNIETSN